MPDGSALCGGNRLGAGGVIALTFVARASAGHTFLMASDAQFAILLRKNLPYDPVKDFALVENVGSTPLSSIPRSISF